MHQNIRPRYIRFLECCSECTDECLLAGGGLVSSEIKSPSDLFSFSHVRNATRLADSRLNALRTVSSSDRGMRATVSEQVGDWQANAKADVPADSVDPHPRIGIGLPMSNIYATYFGGSLELVSLDGYGEQNTTVWGL